MNRNTNHNLNSDLNPRGLNNLTSVLKNQQMTDSEKQEVFGRIMTDIRLGKSSILEHSDRVIERDLSIKSSITKSWSTYVLSRRFVPSFVMVAVLFISGGLLSAADQALPGDRLYALKLNINEEVRDITALTPEAKARLAIAVTERRLQEATTLSTQGRLDSSSQDLLKKEIAKNATQFQNRIASLVSHNNLSSAQQLSVDFESSLKAHELILEKISADDNASSTTGNNSAVSLLAEIKDQIATSSMSRAGVEGKEQVAIANNLDKVKDKFNTFKIIFEEISFIASSTHLSVDTASTVRPLLNEVGIMLGQSEDLIKQGSSSQAYDLIQAVSQKLYQAESLIMIERDADPELRAILDKLNLRAQLNATSTATSTDVVITVTNPDGTTSTTTSSSTAQ